MRITKNGDGIFMFCSEEIFDERLRQAAEQGAYEERGRGAVRTGHEDVAAGRSYAGLKYAFEAAAALRSAHE